VTATFLELTNEAISRALDWMQRFYALEHIEYEETRAMRALGGLLADPAKGGFWFLETPEAIAGYVVVLAEYSLEFGGSFGLVDELYLDEAWRGKGLGQQALQFAEGWCRGRGIGTLRLEVGRENARALGLYRTSGFLVDERYLMTRRL
jgi:GNAT superfamily N-acetyltransferase